LKNTPSIEKKINPYLQRAMAADRLAALRELKRMQRAEHKPGRNPKLAERLERLQKRLQASARRKAGRRENMPTPRFNEALPIFSRKDEIIAAIKQHQVVVVSGETGSGKTTQLPQYCLAAGRSLDGIIGCTQPRRIAATTVARRIAEELGADNARAVGYKIRFKDRTMRDTYVKIMTDGILLAETQHDRWLSAYDTIIVDEAHERSLNIDFILGILKTLLVRRDDLKLIITSATIDTRKFSEAFGRAPVIEVSGRMYPVEIQYLPEQPGVSQTDDPTHVELAVQAVRRILQQRRPGDMLVFMPSEQDIRETCELIEAEKPPGARVMPLFARLSSADQSRVFSRLPQKKIIVATNVAETSITIPGIRYVIDSGLARIARYSPRTRTTSLPVVPVSKSSCDQRKGRCGRVQNGVCFRLFPENEYQSRPRFTPPEILRANLAEVILRMIHLKLGDIADFPFIDRPEEKSIKDGFGLLFELGAITQRRKVKAERLKEKGKQEGVETGVLNAERRSRVRLTDKGRLMAKIPLDPRLSRMLIEARREGCVQQIAIIAAALSIQDPRERPAEKAQAADRMHAAFIDPRSDFVTLLNIWRRYHAHLDKVKSNNQMKRWCREHYLSFRRMREWRDIHNQITAILAEQGIKELGRRKTESTGRKEKNLNETGKNKIENASTSDFQSVHRAILSGFLSNIAQKKEKNIFQAAKGREVMIFPGSGLFNKNGNWIVAAEIVKTSRTFARTVAVIDPEWLEDLGGDLCRRTYLDPHWERNRGEVVASLQISLFGLIIVAGRKVSFGKIDPRQASDIFIQSALVNGDVKKPFGFMTHNRRLIEDVLDKENRIRRRDLLVDEQQMAEFYRQRLPEIYDLRSLSRLLKQKGGDHFLRMGDEDLLQHRPDESELQQYPKQLALGGHSLECSYCFAPGTDNDGITLKVPAALTPHVPPAAVDWLVPGLLAAKIEALIKGLPKIYRKKLVPVKKTVQIIIHEMPRTNGSLISALTDFIHRRFAVDIPAKAWSPQLLPEHLKMRICITASDGRQLHVGRDPAILGQDVAGDIRHTEFEAARRQWEKSGITRWDFGDLPESIGASNGNSTGWIAYPALEKDSSTKKQVNLRLITRRQPALETHRQGVAALFAIHFARELKFLKRRLTFESPAADLTDYFGGARRLQQHILKRVVRDLFGKNIRSAEAFYDHAAAAAAQILPLGEKLCELATAVITAYGNARRRFAAPGKSNVVNSPIQHFFQHLTHELNRLVPDSFVTLYDMNRLPHLVRYIRALEIRAERAMIDFEKDRAKSETVRRFTDHLDSCLTDLPESASAEKRQALEDYFWLIEEYKVSIFAQELKTAVPVSAKRLEQKMKQIERMA
jgi:ATP-dependent helicase HrpA